MSVTDTRHLTSVIHSHTPKTNLVPTYITSRYIRTYNASQRRQSWTKTPIRILSTSYSCERYVRLKGELRAPCDVHSHIKNYVRSPCVLFMRSDGNVSTEMLQCFLSTQVVKMFFVLFFIFFILLTIYFKKVNYSKHCYVTYPFAN